MEILKEIREKAKGMSLVARGMDDQEGTYQIWSSGSNDEENQNPTHGAMFTNYEEDGKEKVT